MEYIIILQGIMDLILVVIFTFTLLEYIQTKKNLEILEQQTKDKLDEFCFKNKLRKTKRGDK